MINSLICALASPFIRQGEATSFYSHYCTGMQSISGSSGLFGWRICYLTWGDVDWSVSQCKLKCPWLGCYILSRRSIYRCVWLAHVIGICCVHPGLLTGRGSQHGENKSFTKSQLMKFVVLLDFDTNIDLQLLFLKWISGTWVGSVLFWLYPMKFLHLRDNTYWEDEKNESDQNMRALVLSPQSKKHLCIAVGPLLLLLLPLPCTWDSLHKLNTSRQTSTFGTPHVWNNHFEDTEAVRCEWMHFAVSLAGPEIISSTSLHSYCLQMLAGSAWAARGQVREYIKPQVSGSAGISAGWARPSTACWMWPWGQSVNNHCLLFSTSRLLSRRTTWIWPHQPKAAPLPHVHKQTHLAGGWRALAMDFPPHPSAPRQLQFPGEITESQHCKGCKGCLQII